MKPFIPQKLPLTDLAWEPLIPLIGKANRAIAEFGGVLYGVPNPEVLLAPLTTTEAVRSSRIEGTQATVGEVLKFDAGEQPALESRRGEILEIINYRRALEKAKQSLIDRPFNLNLLLELHGILLDSVRGRDKGRGRFRTTQNWIGAPNSPIEQADFVPPDPLQVPAALDNWEKYYHLDRPDPLVQLAIIHAQFEIIHPFSDGNGRIGRILIPLFLYERKILHSPVFYLSAYLDNNREEYVARLRSLGNDINAWNEWIDFFLRAIDEQARMHSATARAIIDLYGRMKKQFIDITSSAYAIPLLDLIFRKVIFASTDIALPTDKKPSRQAISGFLKSLRDAGILEVVREGRGRQPQILVFTELVHLCE